MYLIYSLALGFLALLTGPYWLAKGIRQRKYLSNFRQRLGFSLPASPMDPKPIWIHAVSVGEVLSAKPLVRALRAVRPDLSLAVTTVTVTGQSLARREFAGTATVLYFPFDWDFCIRRFLRSVRPKVVILMETELWPNFLKNCGAQGVPVLLLNGRISDRSFPRYRRVRWLTGIMIRKISRIGAQTALDRERFVQLGGREGQVTVTGNLKFDLPLQQIDENDPVLQLVRSSLRLRPATPVIVVGSSMRGEETHFIRFFMQIRCEMPEARLILAPRHPERFEEVAQLLSESGLCFRRRTRAGPDMESPAEVLLLDTIGELRRIYSLATVAIIGGSFLPFGGHNPLEPAGLGKAIVFGPEMRNFREIARIFLEGEAARQCPLQSLPQVVMDLLTDEGARSRLGERALQTYRQNQGAAGNALRLLLPYLS